MRITVEEELKRAVEVILKARYGEGMGIFKSLITQNVDNLHRAAGSKKLLEIHGNYTLLRYIQLPYPIFSGRNPF